MGTDVSVKPIPEFGDESEEPRERFGRYALLESLGTGGMAQVFRALHPMMGGDFGKIVAVKRILPCFTEEKDFVDLLLDEARLTLRLSHANIAQTYEVGQVGEHYYLAMEYIDGYTLAAVDRSLKRAGVAMPTDVAIYIAMQAAAGLHAAHTARDDDGSPLQVIHRDVSPHNIMLDRHGAVKLIDFGVAKAQDRIVHTIDGAVRGKLSFFSPERADGQDFDQRADLFALGLVLWIMITGEHPLQGMGQVESMLAMQRWKAPLLREHRIDASEELEQVLLRVLDPEPDRRYTDGEALRAALARILYSATPEFSPRRLAELLHRVDRGVLSSGAMPVPRLPSTEQSTLRSRDLEAVSADGVAVSELPTILQVPRSGVSGVVELADITERPTELHDGPSADYAAVEVELSRRSIARRPAPRNVMLWVVGLMCVSAFLGAFAVIVFKGQADVEHHPGARQVQLSATTSESASAQLDLSSTPPGAAVFLNDEPTGTSTPVVLDLPAEPFLIRLELAEYSTKEVHTELDPGRRKVMQLELTRAAAEVDFTVKPASTVVLYFPDLTKRFLLMEGRSVAVSGLQVGQEVVVYIQREHEPTITRTVTPQGSRDAITLSLDGG